MVKDMYDDDESKIEKVASEMTRVMKEFQTFGEQVNARVLDLEQKSFRTRGEPYSSRDGFYGPSLGIGAQVAELEGLQALSAGQRGKVSLSVKALTSVTGSAGALADAEHSVTLPIRRTRPSMRDVLMGAPTSHGAVEYPRRTARTNGAAPQVEGELKGESGLTYELIVAPVRTIATWIPASKQILDDAPGLAALIDYELTRNLRDVEEAQLLHGDGTGVNLLGLVPLATAFAAPWTISSPTMIDTLLLALAQLESDTENEASFIALNPMDWRRIQSLKATDGTYLSGSAFTASDVERLWALPLVPTAGMTIDNFLVGDGTAASVRDRQQATVEVSTEDGQNFRTNMITIRAEERLALEIRRPAGFVYGSFGVAAP